MSKIRSFFDIIGGLTEFGLRYFKYIFIKPMEFGQIKKHMFELGTKTLPIVGITGFIIGAVLTLQSFPFMHRFGAEQLLPYMVSISVVTELGPVLTALIFAGRVSSGIGAELGSMKVTEQIDAMEVSAIDPYNYLVFTRVTACALILPLLTVYVDVIAIVGGFLAMVTLTDTSWSLYLDRVVEIIAFRDLLPGVGKTAVFGFITGIVGTYYGFHASKGTEGVGKASTTSVVISSLLILVFDLILVKLSLMLW